MERGLYIVPTPLGNLSDITERAKVTLAGADVIAAEDTRHSLRLLRHLDIDRPMLAYHEHAHEKATVDLVARVVAGQAVALISDAGTPLISDPGYRLVRAMQDAGCPVVPLPGPCAAIAALSASGLPTDRFLFEGFLPAKTAQRRQRLEALCDTQATLVFYESPHRIVEMLNDALTAFGPERETVIARELTKTFETIKRLPLAELVAWMSADSNQQRGEFVVMFAPDRRAAEVDAATLKLLHRLAQELPPRKAAAVVADISGVKARALYDVLLARKDD